MVALRQYTVKMAGVEGVEPSHTVPETAVLPLDDTPSAYRCASAAFATRREREWIYYGVQTGSSSLVVKFFEICRGEPEGRMGGRLGSRGPEGRGPYRKANPRPHRLLLFLCVRVGQTIAVAYGHVHGVAERLVAGSAAAAECVAIAQLVD